MGVPCIVNSPSSLVISGTLHMVIMSLTSYILSFPCLISEDMWVECEAETQRQL